MKRCLFNGGPPCVPFLPYLDTYVAKIKSLQPFHFHARYLQKFGPMEKKLQVNTLLVI